MKVLAVTAGVMVACMAALAMDIALAVRDYSRGYFYE